MWTIKVGVHPGAGTEVQGEPAFERTQVRRIDRPHPDEGRIELIHDGLGARLRISATSSAEVTASRTAVISARSDSIVRSCAELWAAVED